MIAFLLAAQLATAQPFVSPADFPSVDFGRLMPGDPVPDQPGKVFQHTGAGWIVSARADQPPAAAEPVLPASVLKVGHAYVYQPTGARVFISGAGQLPGGEPVIFAVCLRAAINCAGPYAVWLLPANVDASPYRETRELW